MARAVVASLVCLGLLGGCASAPRGKAPAGPPPSTGGGTAAGGSTEQGISLYQQGRYAEAEAVLSTAPGGTARAYLAATRVRLGRYAEAEGPALESLRADPADPLASAALGEALVSQGKLDEAIVRLSDVLRAGPTLPYAHFWRGQAYQRRQQVARMAEDYEAFLKLAPNAPEAAAVRAVLDGLR